MVLLVVVGYSDEIEDHIKKIREAAEQGEAWAQNSVGGFYYNGVRVIKDYEKAVKWWRLAAEQGYAEAQFNLGLCYYNEKGVIKNYESAYYWFSLAARNGNEETVMIRDIIEKKLAPEVAEKVREEARRWLEERE